MKCQLCGEKAIEAMCMCHMHVCKSHYNECMRYTGATPWVHPKTRMAVR